MWNSHWYIERYPSGSAVYGRMTRTCLFTTYKYVGIKTFDQHDDCVLAAVKEILDKDSTAIIHFEV